MVEIVSIPERQILTTRIIKATRAIVYAAWTEPSILAWWWGPMGFTNTFHEFDLRPGGFWRYTMHGPQGADYKNESRFVDLAAPESIVFDHLSPPQFHTTVIFSDEGSFTRVTWQMLFPTPTEFEKVRGFAVQKNEENLDRLEAILAETV